MCGACVCDAFVSGVRTYNVCVCILCDVYEIIGCYCIAR